MVEFNNPLRMSPVFMLEWNLSGVDVKSRLINLGIKDRSVERIGSARREPGGSKSKHVMKGFDF